MSWPEQIFRWLGYGKYLASPMAVADGGTSPLLIDPYGRLRVASEGIAPTGYHRSINATNGAVKASPGDLVELWGFSNDSTQTLFLMLVNKTSAPTDGDLPQEVFRVPASQSVGFRPGSPLAFASGIAWAVSTAPDVVALPLSGGDFVVTVAYR